MLRVITLNVNGLRAALKKGLLTWLSRSRADVVCLQEIRLGREGVPEQMTGSLWHGSYCPAERPGYSGTAVLTRVRPSSVQYGFGVDEFDGEGRYCAVNIGGLVVASVYAPSGSSGDHRQQSKDRFLNVFQPYCASLVAPSKSASRCPVIIAGDINIAHTKKDLKNWSSNQRNSGFLPHERSWMDDWLSAPPAPGGEAVPANNAPQTPYWCDVFRLLNDKDHQYTWWSNRGRAWENNVGWRIDYQIATNDVAHSAVRARIYKDKRFSDHSPVIIDYDINPCL